MSETNAQRLDRLIHTYGIETVVKWAEIRERLYLHGQTPQGKREAAERARRRRARERETLESYKARIAQLEKERKANLRRATNPGRLGPTDPHQREEMEA